MIRFLGARSGLDSGIKGKGRRRGLSPLKVVEFLGVYVRENVKIDFIY